MTRQMADDEVLRVIVDPDASDEQMFAMHDYVAALQAERDALRVEVGEVREAYQARTRDWYSQGDAYDAALQRAERAESALEALRGQVAELVELFARVIDAEFGFGEWPTEEELRAALLAIKERMG